MNRVYCLYRVSTVQQLHEDDIPMQRQACQEFAAARGWKVIKEFYEKGISGFKTPTADRRVLQQIKKDAKQHEFDSKRKNSRRLVRVKCLCQTIRV